VSERRSDFVDYVAARRAELRRLAYLLSGDWHAADDIVQISLDKLYRAWPRVHRASAEDAYARKVLVRTAIDESRRPWRRERALPEVPEPPGEGLGSEPQGDLGVDVVRALRTLPPQQHKVVVLRYWLGLSVAEAATVLGIADGTVKSQCAKALTKLRPLLDEHYERTT
jgi:RNA polymerase sigma-70 factor (sigma-E family)